MTNPTPRPALRKAEDADVHPAAPSPARRPRTTPAKATAGAATTSAPADSGGSTAAPATAADVPAASSKVGAAAPAKAKGTPAARARSANPSKTQPGSSGEPQAAAAIAAAPDSAAPATAAPKRSKRYQTPPAVPAKTKRKPTGFTGTTSDHLRSSDAPATPAAETADKAAKQRAKADAALLTGSLTTVKVELPKKLKKAAEKEAARRGLDLDAVTAELLHTWLTHRP